MLMDHSTGLFVTPCVCVYVCVWAEVMFVRVCQHNSTISLQQKKTTFIFMVLGNKRLEEVRIRQQGDQGIRMERVVEGVAGTS